LADKKKLKILLTIHHGHISTGSGFQLYLLAKELKKRGHRVFALFKGDRNGEVHPSLRRMDDIDVDFDFVKFTKLKYRHTIPEVFWLRNHLIEEKYDCITAFGGTDLDHLILATVGVRVPVMIACRGMAMKLDMFNSVKYRTKKVSRVVAVSQAIKEVMVQTGHVNPNKITVIYGGVELERFHPELDPKPVRAALGILANAQVVTIIDGFFWFRENHTKGGYYFVKAAELVLASRPDARFLMVGGIDEEGFKKLASPALTRATVMTGHRSDVPELLAATDLLVSASLSEGLGMVIAEAFAMKKPAVGTNVGGIPELVRPGQTGILTPVRDEKAIAQAVLEMLGQPEQMRKMGETGRKLVEDICSNERRADRWEELYFEEYGKFMSRKSKKS
jgi:glycosyltransferase involved in cell wall biosynthesis